MIICVQCDIELINNQNNLDCPVCGYSAPIKDGIVLFKPDVDKDYENYNATGLDTLYSFERKHFWFKNRREIIVDMFQKHVPKTASIIEIGAGTGNVARRLLDQGYSVSVGDIHYSGLKYSQTYGIQQLYQFDLLSPPFRNHFDVVAMFDVLEHFEEEDNVMQSISSVLKPGGIVVLTVPAHSWLWNRDDETAHHKRRYSLKQLGELTNNNGFDIIENKHFFVAILPLLYLRTILHPASGKRETSNGQENIPGGINFILDKITQMERFLLKPWQPSWGGSIISVVQKR